MARKSTLWNVGLVVAYLIPTVLLLHHFFIEPRRAVQTYRAGERMESHERFVAPGENTLVLAIKSSCRFCTENMQLYRTLLASRAMRVVVAALEPREDALAYLQQHDLLVDEVISVAGSEVGIFATPTVLVLDEFGTVKYITVGAIPEDQQSAMMREVRELAASGS